MSPVTGKHIYVGNAGESLVVGELLRRGVVAALAPRNTPHFDLLATNGKTTVGVRVKTHSMHSRSWVTRAAATAEHKNHEWDRPIFPEKMTHDAVALVDLKNPDALPIQPVEFWVVPTATLETWLQAKFKEWALGSESRNRDNWERRFGATKDDLDWLEQWRSRWDLITSPLSEDATR